MENVAYLCNVNRKRIGYPGDIPARGKPLSTLPKTTNRAAIIDGSFYFPLK